MTWLWFVVGLIVGGGVGYALGERNGWHMAWRLAVRNYERLMQEEQEGQRG